MGVGREDDLARMGEAGDGGNDDLDVVGCGFMRSVEWLRLILWSF